MRKVVADKGHSHRTTLGVDHRTWKGTVWFTNPEHLLHLVRDGLKPGATGVRARSSPPETGDGLDTVEVVPDE